MVEAHYYLGLAYSQLGHTAKAIREFQAILGVYPDDANLHYCLGLAYWQQGRLMEARREAQRALQLGHEPARQLIAWLG